MINSSAYKKTARVFLAAIIILAICLRMNGIGQGLPYFYNDDDHWVMNAVINMVHTGDMNPHWFGFPGSFLMYFLAGIFGASHALLFFIIKVSGHALDYQGMINQLCTDRISYFAAMHYTARVIMVFFSVVSIYLVYRISRVLFRNPYPGLLAAFCLSISPLHVEHSRYIRPDIPTSTLVLSAIYLLFLFDKRKDKISLFIGASLISGAAVAVKYTSGLVALPLVFYALHLDRMPCKIFSVKYFLSCLSLNTYASKALFYMFAGFFIFAPYVFLDINTAFSYMVMENRSEHVGHERLGVFLNHAWYVKGVLIDGIGGVFFALISLAGFIMFAAKTSIKRIVFALFPVVYYFIIVQFGKLRWYRWLIPALPFQAVFFGFGFHEMFKKLAATRFFMKRRQVLFYGSLACVILFAAPAIRSDVSEGMRLNRDDTRLIAKYWIEANIPEGSKIAYEWGTPYLYLPPSKPYALVNAGDAIVNYPFQFYTDNKVDYIVLTKELRDTVLAEPVKYRVPIERYNEINRNAELIKVIDNSRNPGSVIEIYKLKKAVAA